MKSHQSLAVTASLLAAVASVSAQTVPATGPSVKEVSETLQVPDGFEVTLWASTPMFFNPTNIDVDARGRIYVAEAVNYRETQHPQHAMMHPNGDRIMILEDTDHDGVADSSKVFVEDKDLVAPLGVAVLGNKVVVSDSPNIFIYTDTDGDDKADKRETFLTGWGGFDYDHGVHAVVGGLDGRWYFNCGNSGPHEVTDKAGWHLSSGSVFTSGKEPNTGNRKSSDGRVWVGGLVLSVNPDGTGLKVHAHNFRNNFEVAPDSFGDLWQTDNDDDGNQSCRMTWIMEGGNYGYFSADGTRAWSNDRRPGQSIQTAHWHQEDPGVIPSVEITGAGGPTGSVVYEGGIMPKEWVGSVLACDAGRNRVSIFKPIPSGAGFKFERSDLIAAKPQADGSLSEQARDFRPSDVMVGTDGAIYVADWYDPMVGGHNILDKVGGGRILRITPKGAKPEPAKVDLASVGGAIAALSNPSVDVRYQAAEKIQSFGDAGKAALEKLAGEGDPLLRARAVTTLARFGKSATATFEKALQDSDDRVRVSAFRSIELTSSDRVPALAKELAGDESPAVRRAAALAMRDVPLEQSSDTLVQLASAYDGKDRFFLEAIGTGCDGKEEKIYPLLVEKFGQGDPVKWSDQMVGLAWRLHPVAALDAFEKRATAASLSDDARIQAVTAIAFINDEKAADVMSELATADDNVVREQALWWMHNRADNDWKTYASAQAFMTGPTSQPQARFSQDRMVMLDESAAKRKRETAARHIAQDPEGAKIIIALASEGKFPKSLEGKTADVLYRNPDLSIRAMASQYFPRKTASGQTLPPIAEIAKMPGDIANGKKLFAGTAGCIKCHMFAGEGADIGPDLTAVRTKYGRPEALDAILNPSAGILMGYETWIIKTRDNQVYAGFITGDGDTVTLKESTGEKRTIAASDIVLRKKQTISVMPDNIGLGLTAQDLSDLAEYVLKAPNEKPKS